MTKTGSALEIMQRDVATVAPDDTLRDAMALMVEHHVSGLPVIDRKGRCVGVISATDILNLEQQQSEATGEGERELGSYFDSDAQRWETVLSAGALDEIPEIVVREVMSPDVVFLRPDARLQEVAKTIVQSGVHRILILNSDRELLGIISALDFVQLYADGAAG